MGGQGQFMNPQTGIPNGIDLSSLFSGAGRMNAGGFGGQGGPMGGIASAYMPSFAAPPAPGGGRLPMDSMMQANEGPGSMMASSLAGVGGGGSPPFWPGGDSRSMFARDAGGGSPPFNPFPNDGSPPFNPQTPGMEFNRSAGGGSPPFNPPNDPPVPADVYSRRSGGGSPPFNPGGVGRPGLSPPRGPHWPPPRPGGGRPQSPSQPMFVPDMSFTPEMNWETYRSLTPQNQQHPAWRSFVASQPAPGRGSAY